MTRVPAVFPSLMCLVALSWCASPADADPILVTSGVVEAGGAVDQLWNAEVLSLHGAGFRIENSLEDEDAFVRLVTRPIVAPGATVDLSGVLHVEDSIGALVNNSFGAIAAPFTMSFDVAPMRLTCNTDGSLTRCTGIAPFRFESELTFTPFGGGPAVHHLLGRGTAEGILNRSGFGEGGNVRYSFESSAVPEPATLSLFATGAIVAGAGVWRRRRAGRGPA